MIDQFSGASTVFSSPFLRRKGILGMGGGFILAGVLGLILPLPAALFIHAVTQFTANTYRASLHWKYIQIRIVKNYVIGMTVTVALFSLGSVIYEMSCGRPPFRAPDLLGVLRRVAEDTPRSMRSVLSSIPVWLERIVERLHAKMPEERLGSAGELHKALSACRENLTSNAPIQIDSLLPKKYKEIDTSSAPVTK